MSLLEIVNGGAVLAVIGLAYRTEARITRLETIIETLTGKRGCA